VSPVKIKEEKEEVTKLHVCPNSSVISVFVPYLSEMSSINFAFRMQLIIELENPLLCHSPQVQDI
jgi:hypothetical protein